MAVDVLCLFIVMSLFGLLSVLRQWFCCRWFNGVASTVCVCVCVCVVLIHVYLLYNFCHVAFDVLCLFIVMSLFGL